MELKVLWTIASSMGTVSDLKMLNDIKDFHVDVITADVSDKDCPGFEITGKKYILPDGYDPLYIKKMMDICKAEKVTTVIPQYGRELLTLSRHRKLFEKNNIKVLVTEDSEKLRIAEDKLKLFRYFKDREFIPDFEYATSAGEIEKAIYKLGYPDVPVCIKPVNGEGGRGFKVLTEEPMNPFCSQGDSLKVRWDIMKQQIKAEKIPGVMVMEYLPGAEYSVDCVAKEGRNIVCIPRRRVETAMGVATVSIIEKKDDLIELSKEIISKLNLSYNINIQFKYSADGNPKLIEINPRVSGTLIANYGAGVNMLETSLKAAYGIPIEEINIVWGTKMMRYYDQIFTKSQA